MQRTRARAPNTFFVLLLVICVRAQGKDECASHAMLCFSGPYCVRFENEVCEDAPREDCRQETRQDCQTINETNCVPATEEVCETVPSAEESCTEVDREVCKEVPQEVCVPRTETQCKDVERVDCPEFAKRAECNCHVHHHDKRRLLLCQKNCAIVHPKRTAPCTTKTEKECVVVQKEDCFTNSTTQCETITDRNCVPLEETSCMTKSTQNCETKPVENCTDRQEEVCETITEQSCRTEGIDRFCGDEEEDLLRSLILNGDVLGASAVLSDSQNLFSLGAGLTYLPEQNFLIVQSANRSRDPDVVAFQSLASASLNDTDVTKLVNAILLSVRQDCRCTGRSAAEFDTIARGLKEDFRDREYLKRILDDDLSEFGGGGGKRRLLGTSVSPVDSFVCAYCSPQRSCSKLWWC